MLGGLSLHREISQNTGPLVFKIILFHFSTIKDILPQCLSLPPGLPFLSLKDNTTPVNFVSLKVEISKVNLVTVFLFDLKGSNNTVETKIFSCLVEHGTPTQVTTINL